MTDRRLPEKRLTNFHNTPLNTRTVRPKAQILPVGYTGAGAMHPYKQRNGHKYPREGRHSSSNPREKIEMTPKASRIEILGRTKTPVGKRKKSNKIEQKKRPTANHRVQLDSGKQANKR